jgi:site-specific DNA-methyltransferase (adenine-specific)
MISEVHNSDCLAAMREMPDKCFELAIVDPPYGIGAGSEKFANGNTRHPKNFYRSTDWDIKPNAEYFSELMRVSVNQIIFGGNYFSELLPSSRGFIVWDKTIYGNTYADCEFAWTSFDTSARLFRMNICEITLEGRIHPTQKPIKFYAWLLSKYAKPGDRILDTHLGSGSSRIAAYDLGFDFTGYELDKDYFDAQEERFTNHAAQPKLFVPEVIQPKQVSLI